MSFKLLKKEIIDFGLCQGCGLCAGSCKHIEMETLRPSLKDYCILERNGIDCGSVIELVLKLFRRNLKNCNLKGYTPLEARILRFSKEPQAEVL